MIIAESVCQTASGEDNNNVFFVTLIEKTGLHITNINQDFSNSLLGPYGRCYGKNETKHK